MKDIEFKLSLHQRLAALADLLMFHHDPCHMQGGACLAGDPNPCCIRTRFKRDTHPADKRCRFIGETGCEFPNIECKVWFCQAAEQAADPRLLDAMRMIFAVAKRYELTNER